MNEYEQWSHSFIYVHECSFIYLHLGGVWFILGNGMKKKMGMQGNENRNEHCIDVVWLTQYNQ